MRVSGILLPLSALPSDYGIGTMGKDAYDFADFLSDSCQHYWQILPLGHTGYANSPYQCFSAFAGNPYYIDPFLLYESGYIKEHDLPFQNNEGRVDYGRLYSERLKLLKKAAQNVNTSSVQYRTFEKNNSFWLEDYAVFMAVKESQGMKPLNRWCEELRLAEDTVYESVREKAGASADIWKRIQFLFYDQWFSLKQYANSKDIEIIGDLPIYVSADSCEMWLHKELFITDDDGNPALLSGCPPDEYSPFGQLWGNPVYDWVSQHKDGFSWWISRLKHASEIYDAVRIDHFRGFESYYAVPSTASDAVNGEWYKGPSRDFIDAVKRAVPQVRIIAEDLGNITDKVRDLLCYSDFPGMKILQFGLDGNTEHLPHSFTRHSVAYTGTHDNPTLKQWSLISDNESLSFAKKYLNVNNAGSLVNDCIRALYMSVSETVIIPLQDWLCLGNEARMNVPSTVEGNWEWRVKKEMLTEALSVKIADMTKLYSRIYREEKQ